MIFIGLIFIRLSSSFQYYRKTLNKKFSYNGTKIINNKDYNSLGNFSYEKFGVFLYLIYCFLYFIFIADEYKKKKENYESEIMEELNNKKKENKNEIENEVDLNTKKEQILELEDIEIN